MSKKIDPANRGPEVAVARRADGTFIGSGNPSGRPKKLAEVEALAAEHTVDAIDTLHRIMMEDLRATESGIIVPTAQIRAAEIILERAWGKPRQPMDHTSNGETLRSLDDLRAVVAEVEQLQKQSEGKESILQ
jgi:hypothetical protein